MRDANSVKTHSEQGSKLEIDNKSKQFNKHLYQSAVSSLLFLSTRTRPDTALAVKQVSRYCSNPTEHHWSAVKRIFRFKGH